MTVRIADALAHARAQGLARLDAQLLLSRRLQQSRAWLLAHDDDVMPAQEWAAFESDVTRRAAGEPLAYIVGQREFHGLTLRVTPAVLVPRPETELLVEWGLEHLVARRASSRPLTAIDLGTGSGAIALAIKHSHPAVRMMAVDRSQDALQVARANAGALGLEVEFALSDWWVAAAGRTFDLALANPPYIDADDGHLQQLSHEPADALTPGRDGMSAIREVIQGAPMHLNAGAVLLVEHGYDQAPAVRDLLGRNGFFDIETRNDLAGIPRCTGAHRG